MPARWGLWLLAALSVVASLGFLGWRVLGPSDGGQVPFYSDSWRVNGVVVTAVDEDPSGLRTGDVVVAIYGRSLSEWIDGAFDPTLDRGRLTDGATVPYTVIRDGELREIDVVYTPRNPSQLLIDNWSNILLAAVMLGVGLFVLWRRPALSASVALAVIGCGMAGSMLPWLLGLQPSDIVFSWPYLVYLLTAAAIYLLLWAGGLHLPLAMNATPSRRTLALVYGLPLGGYALILAATRLVTPTSTAWLGTVAPAQLLIVIPCALIGFWLAVRAYRGAEPGVRKQVRWAVAGAGVAFILGLSLIFVPQLLTGRSLVPLSVLGLFVLPAPIGVAIGILRYRMFDIEIVVNRTLVYGGVTAVILGVYTSAVLIIGAVLPQAGGFPASLVATGVAAVLALPVRDRLQRAVNRLMYGDRDDPYRALARLAQRLESTIEPVAMPRAVVESVAEALRLPYVALEIGPPDAVEMQESRGQPVDEPLAIPLVYGAEIVGRLLLSPRAPGESFSRTDMRLLDDLARSAGAAVHAVRLTLDVMRSRERLVAAREEERRRIRRDLHDGLGPTLAAIGMRAELAAELAGKDTPAVEVLTKLTTDVGTALADIRRLVDGLRPPALDELGLVGAIETQARLLGPEPAFEIRAVGEIKDLPAAVEVAAFRICVEAMTNAARHAGAQRCEVILKVGPAGRQPDRRRVLEIVVRDNGRGMEDVVHAGIGIASMRERAAEVGGSFEVDRRAGGGTVVRAELPFGSGVDS